MTDNSQTHSVPTSRAAIASTASSHRWSWIIVLAAAFFWSYWPTLGELERTWNREPDYSHGYLVLPLFVLFLWIRRDQFPQRFRPSWWGIAIIAASIGMRYVGAAYFLTPLDGWSIVVWVAGAAVCLGGWPLLRWALGPTLFLAFMVPLPFRAETLISQPLQLIAAQMSSFVLRCLGQPAFAENTTLLLENSVLEVERSCSGLRIFVGIFALASGYLLAFRREVWEGVLLIISAVPIALVANAARIVVTAILFQRFSDDAARHFSHDVAGWLMIPLAAGLLALVQWYLNCLVRDVTVGEMGDLVKRHQVTT